MDNGVRIRLLKAADANRAVAVQPEDFVEGIYRRRGRRDDRAAEDGHLALVHVAAPDGEAAVDDGGDAQHKAEHHDHGQTVADAGLQVGGVEGRALREGGQDVEREQGRDGERGAQTRPDFFRNELFFHSFIFLFSRRRFPPNTRSSSQVFEASCAGIAQDEIIFRAGWKP